MAGEKIVIIGNGPAANTAAETLREKDPAAKITLIGREPVRVYRPHLLPELIAGNLDEERLYIHPFEFYKERDIALRLGQEVVSVDFDTRKLVLAHKEVLHFDGLIIATGARPRIPERLQVFEDLMMTLKTVADAKAWMDTLDRIDSVLVIGGDLTSIGFTRTLLKLGKKVYFILERDAFWPMRFSDELRDEVSHCLVEQGVEVLDCRRINGMALLHDGQVEVETDCLHVHVGAVGAFFGLVPDIRFLARSRLYLERGILVDEFLQTRFEGVYAAGDCAQVYHPDLRDYWVSVGYENAQNLGRIAATNLAGGKVQAEADSRSIFRVDGISVNTSWWSEFSHGES